MTCTPSNAISASACFDACLPQGQQGAVQTMLLAKLAGVSLDPNTLMAQASCMVCLNGIQGAVLVYLLSLLATASRATGILLQSPNGTIWSIGVGNDCSLIIATASGPADTIVLASPDTTHWAITIGDDGSISTTPTGAALTSPVTVKSPDGTSHAVTIGNDGSIIVSCPPPQVLGFPTA